MLKLTGEERGWIIETIDARNTTFRSIDFDSYPDRMSGYLLALYDLGIVSWNKLKDYEKKFNINIFEEDLL